MLSHAIENTDALLPTHILAVYDQDATLDTMSDQSLPYTSTVPSGPPSLPATPLMIPVNAELWSLHFASSFVSQEASSPTTPPERPSSSSSYASTSSRSSSQRDSLLSLRPRKVLTLPVIIVRVPAASSLPLLLLATLGVVPQNCLATALLPIPVLAELPAASTILTQCLLSCLYKRRSRRSVESSMEGQKSRTRSRDRPITYHSTTTNTSLTPPVMPSPNFLPIDSQRLSPTSLTSQNMPTSPIISHPPPSLFPSRDAEPISALQDQTTEDDPDLRLLRLAQQNFGLWANALALGAKDSSVVQLVELAWTVAGDARRVRFGDPLQHRSGTGPSKTIRKSRSRPHLPPPNPPRIPLPEIPPSR